MSRIESQGHLPSRTVRVLRAADHDGRAAAALLVALGLPCVAGLSHGCSDNDGAATAPTSSTGGDGGGTASTSSSSVTGTTSSLPIGGTGGGTSPGDCAATGYCPSTDDWCAMETGRCVPWPWHCSRWEYWDEVCSCGCGAADPACDEPSAALVGCAPGQSCSDEGACVGTPGEWTCDDLLYGAHDGCECLCGIVDADCVPGGPAAGCEPDQSCAADGSCTTPTAAAPRLTIDTFPQLDGATAMQPLATLIACELLGVPWSWTWLDTGVEEGYTISPAPETPTQQALADQIAAKVALNKTHQAYLNLISGSRDLILVASLPSADELAYASTLGVTLDPRPVALDGLVFLVYDLNPVQSATIEQLRGIFSQQILWWNELGGPTEPIAPYVRTENSGSQQLMDALVMQGVPMGDFPEWFTSVWMGGMIDKVRSDERSIGYSVYYYVTYQYVGPGAKLLQIDGIWPTPGTIADRSYPLTSESYVVVRTDLAEASPARQLRDWLLGPEGQSVVAMSGYVPVQ